LPDPQGQTPKVSALQVGPLLGAISPIGFRLMERLVRRTHQDIKARHAYQRFGNIDPCRHLEGNLVSDQVLPGYTPAEAVLLPTQARSWPSFNALRARIGRPGEGDAMAEALGARISGRHGAQEADTPTPVRESRPYQNLPDWPRQSRQEQKDLALKAKCTTTKERPISRWEQEAVLVQARLDRNPDKMCLRRQTVEHPFGTIKSWMGSAHLVKAPQLRRLKMGLLGRRSSKAQPSAKSDTGCTVCEQSLCNFDHVEKIAAGDSDPKAKEIEEGDRANRCSSHKASLGFSNSAGYFTTELSAC
jgi:hypothetical protein